MKIPSSLLHTLTVAALAAPLSAQAETALTNSAAVPLHEGKPMQTEAVNTASTNVVETAAETEDCPKSNNLEICPPVMDDCPNCGMG